MPVFYRQHKQLQDVIFCQCERFLTSPTHLRINEVVTLALISVS